MVERWRDYKMLRTTGGRRCTNVGGFLWILGVIFALLGVIGELATNGTLGLKSESWFSLAIAVSVLSLAYWIGWAVAVYVDYKESKK